MALHRLLVPHDGTPTSAATIGPATDLALALLKGCCRETTNFLDDGMKLPSTGLLGYAPSKHNACASIEMLGKPSLDPASASRRILLSARCGNNFARAHAG